MSEGKPERKKCIYGFGICRVREEMDKETKQPMVKVLGPSKPPETFSDAHMVTKEAKEYARAMGPFIQDMLGKIIPKTDWHCLHMYCHICPKYREHTKHLNVFYPARPPPEKKKIDKSKRR